MIRSIRPLVSLVFNIRVHVTVLSRGGTLHRVPEAAPPPRAANDDGPHDWTLRQLADHSGGDAVATGHRGGGEEGGEVDHRAPRAMDSGSRAEMSSGSVGIGAPGVGIRRPRFRALPNRESNMHHVGPGSSWS